MSRKFTKLETDLLNKLFFEEIVEKQGLLPEFSSKDLLELHGKAFAGDLTSMQLMIALYKKIIPQLDQDLLQQVREESNDN